MFLVTPTPTPCPTCSLTCAHNLKFDTIPVCLACGVFVWRINVVICDQLHEECREFGKNDNIEQWREEDTIASAVLVCGTVLC